MQGCEAGAFFFLAPGSGSGTLLEPESWSHDSGAFFKVFYSRNRHRSLFCASKPLFMLMLSLNKYEKKKKKKCPVRGNHGSCRKTYSRVAILWKIWKTGKSQGIFEIFRVIREFYYSNEKECSTWTILFFYQYTKKN